MKLLSCVQLFATPWTVAHQAPPSMGFSRQEYWSGLPFPSPGDLPNPGIELGSPVLQTDALPSEPPGKPNQCKYRSKGLTGMITYNSSISFEIFIEYTKKRNVHTKSYLVSPLSWTYITIKKHILKKKKETQIMVSLWH